ncbi:sugar transferase [Sphingobacterium hotanense]|uniref:sugar transferase n=1 Tax=Sphingobacterium hotanense TaxID=649196 RepID=UPI0021A7866A|nr:sugar transferase [Sphingobacterium hotanense]MCT1525056.1 sugar transferase [Sphingobacterium hotanense]
MKVSTRITSLYRLPVHKRIFDVFAATILLLVVSPLTIVIAIIIKLESNGNIIYKSKRVGANQQIFTLYKFRTMHNGSDLLLNNMLHLNVYRNDDRIDSNIAFVKFKDDCRVTRIGRLLRKTHFDELPQLLNVIKGEMSIIGNRPLEIYEAEKLVKKMKYFVFLRQPA